MNVIYAEQKYELRGHILVVMKIATVKTAVGRASTCYKHTPFNYIRFVVFVIFIYRMFCSFV